MMLPEDAKKRPSRTGYNVVDWEYMVPVMPEGVDLYNSQERANWLSNLTAQILEALDGLAQPKGIAMKTDSDDEDSFAVKTPNKEDLCSVYSYLRSAMDVTKITIWFDLECVMQKTAVMARSVMTGWDGWIWITNNLSQDELMDSDDSLVDVHFEFHNFIFSPKVLSDEYLLHAELNAPPLQSFLHRLEQIPALKFREANYNSSYRKWLQQHHFYDGHGLKRQEDLEEAGNVRPSATPEAGH